VLLGSLSVAVAKINEVVSRWILIALLSFLLSRPIRPITTRQTRVGRG